MNSGAWKPHESIPNEHDLAHEFGVSVGTIRKAIELLVKERLVVRRQGRGTFIVDRTSPEFEHRYNRMRRADGTVINWESQILCVETGEPTSSERARLNLLAPDDEVVRAVRLRRTDGRACIHDQISIVASRMPKAAELFERHPGLVLLAKACNVVLGRYREEISLATADSNWAEALNVPVGTALMRLDRVTFNHADETLEWRIAHSSMDGLTYVDDIDE